MTTLPERHLQSDQRGRMARDGRWSEAIAVGSLDFVEKVKNELGLKAIEHCPNCGGALKIIAAIEDLPAIVRILIHLGLPSRAPSRAPAQRFDLFQTA
jgi:hypothetical protein